MKAECGAESGALRWLLAGVFILVAAATGPALAESAREPAPLTVFAAATLQAPLKELAALFDGGRTKVEFSFDSSGVLCKKIENGAAADLFVAADTPWIEKLAKGGFVRPGTATMLASTTLAVFQPISGKPVKTMADLTALKRIVIGDPATVPAGAYAREALQNAGVWEAVKGKLVFAANGTGVMKLVELGEVDAGIVMAGTPMNKTKALLAFGVPEKLHHPILYPAVVLTAGAQPEKAAEFLAYLKTPVAIAVFAKHGFKPSFGVRQAVSSHAALQGAAHGREE